MFRVIASVLFLAVSSAAFGDTLESVQKVGTLTSRSASLPALGTVTASWIDSSRIVYWEPHGTICCYDLETGSVAWKREKVRHISDWCIHPRTKRLLLRYSRKNSPFAINDAILCVVNCDNGQNEFVFESPKKLEQLKAKLDQSVFDDTVFWGPCTLHPISGNLVLTNSLGRQGGEGVILSPDYTSALQRFPLDANANKLSFSTDGNKAVVCAMGDVLSIYDLNEKRQTLLLGKRTHSESTMPSIVTGPPRLTSAKHDGADTVVYTFDGGCFGKPTLTVEQISTKTRVQYVAKSERMPNDIQFRKQRIALAHSDHELKVINFSGEVVASSQLADKISGVEFSPDGNRILIAGSNGRITIMKYFAEKPNRTAAK